MVDQPTKNDIVVTKKNADPPLIGLNMLITSLHSAFLYFYNYCSLYCIMYAS